MVFNFLHLEDGGHYDGVDDPEVTQFAKKPNQTNFGNIQNPYYEGEIDVFTQGNEQSKQNLLNPDLNDTTIVTSSQNVYYDL